MSWMAGSFIPLIPWQGEAISLVERPAILKALFPHLTPQKRDYPRILDRRRIAPAGGSPPLARTVRNGVRAQRLTSEEDSQQPVRLKAA
jgi:hypothetical protein